MFYLFHIVNFHFDIVFFFFFDKVDYFHKIKFLETCQRNNLQNFLLYQVHVVAKQPVKLGYVHSLRILDGK